MTKQVQTVTPNPHGSLLPHLKQAWLSFNQRDRLRAAALSYYALLSLFPLLVLLIFAVNLFWGDTFARDQVERLAQRFFPGDVPTMIISGVETALNERQPLDLVALGGLIWAASSFFSNLIASLDMIFQSTPNTRPMWRNRLIGAVTIAILAILLTFTVIITYSLRQLSQSVLDYPNVVMRPVSLLTPLLLYTLILTLLFRYVPQSRTRWRAIIPGAFFGGIGWEVSRGLFAWYLENLANYSVVYGSLGAVIALLIWTFVSLAILLLAAEFSAALERWMQPSNSGISTAR